MLSSSPTYLGNKMTLQISYLNRVSLVSQHNCSAVVSGNAIIALPPCMMYLGFLSVALSQIPAPGG